eukprot:354403-Prymnesium_polylepis.2
MASSQRISASSIPSSSVTTRRTTRSGSRCTGMAHSSRSISLSHTAQPTPTARRAPTPSTVAAAPFFRARAPRSACRAATRWCTRVACDTP